MLTNIKFYDVCNGVVYRNETLPSSVVSFPHFVTRFLWKYRSSSGERIYCLAQMADGTFLYVRIHGKQTDFLNRRCRVYRSLVADELPRVCMSEGAYSRYCKDVSQKIESSWPGIKRT